MALMSTPTKTSLVALGPAVDLAGGQLLARPVLAQDEDVGVGPGDLVDRGEDVRHGRAPAQEVAGRAGRGRR